MSAVRRRRRVLLAAWVAACGVGALHASMNHNAESYTDDSQGLGDAGVRRGSWVITPIPVSNPTVGTGLQGVAMYLWEPRTGDDDAPHPISGVGGMYTDEQTWFAGAFHQDFLADDRLRLLAVGGAGEINLEYYGQGADSPFVDAPVDYSLGSDVVFLETQFRLPRTEHWYLGPGYRYGAGEIAFDVSGTVAGLPDVSGRFQNAGLSLSLSYDSRDDNFYPRSGAYGELTWADHGASWGGDFDYGSVAASFNRYIGATDRLTLAFRGAAEHVTDSAPFFDLATVNVRGYPLLRFADDFSLSLHAETRYKFRARWGFVVFADAGWVGGSASDLMHEETIASFGGGLRWQPVADKLLNIGLDLAVTDDDKVVFIQIGERF